MNPRILLVEDDATSAAFLAAAASALPAQVDVATTCAAARVAVAAHPYSLWLIDANLPDGSGLALFRTLRDAGHEVPALAHTAAHERSAIDALLAGGFSEVLVKPLSAARLQAAIGKALGMSTQAVVGPAPDDLVSPVWDDAAAIAALNGSAVHVQALRQLCLGELPQARSEIAEAIRRNDHDALHRVLHKLRASCGFVGAARLAGAVRALQDTPFSGAALDRFDAAVQDTLSSP